MPSETIKYYNTNAKSLSKRYIMADISQNQNDLLVFFSDCTRILELGSGSGREGVFFFEHGFDYYGIDGSEKMIEYSFHRFPILKGRISKKYLPQEFPQFKFQFDGIFCIATMMHFTESELNILLQRIHENLVLGGKLFVSITIDNSKREKDNCLYNELPELSWENIFLCNGFNILDKKINDDNFNRDLIWHNFYLQKNENKNG